MFDAKLCFPGPAEPSVRRDCRLSDLLCRPADLAKLAVTMA